MSNRLVLVDSSAWIGYFGGQSGAVSRALTELLTQHRVAINPVIRVELLTGALHETQYVELEDALQGLHLLPVNDTVWKRTERLRFQLRQAGRLIPVTDVLIAACALLHGCDLLHQDRHFDAIARTLPLKIFHSVR